MITVYGKEDCKWCRLLKKELSILGVEFIYFDIEKEPERRYEYPVEHTTVPAISIDGNFIGGYDDYLNYI